MSYNLHIRMSNLYTSSHNSILSFARSSVSSGETFLIHLYQERDAFCLLFVSREECILCLSFVSREECIFYLSFVSQEECIFYLSFCHDKNTSFIFHLFWAKYIVYLSSVSRNAFCLSFSILILKYFLCIILLAF